MSEAEAATAERESGDGTGLAPGVEAAASTEREGNDMSDCTTHHEACACITARHEAELAKLRRSLRHCKDWYAVRIERITDLAKEHGIWPEVATVIANGTTHCAEPPTYAQIVSTERHRAERSEAELAELRAENEHMRRWMERAIRDGGIDHHFVNAYREANHD